MVPKSVAIVGFGFQKHPWVPDHMQWPVDQIWDLREWLNEPLSEDRVRHEENGEFPKTIIAVYRQQNFAGAIETIIENIVHSSKAWLVEPVGCRQGIHRADTVGRTVEAILNRFTDCDGHRLYNAQFFPLNEANSKRESCNILDQSWRWSQAAWTLMPTTTNPLYAEAEVRKREEATASFAKIWEHANKVQCKLELPFLFLRWILPVTSFGHYQCLSI